MPLLFRSQDISAFHYQFWKGQVFLCSYNRTSDRFFLSLFQLSFSLHSSDTFFIGFIKVFVIKSENCISESTGVDVGL